MPTNLYGPGDNYHPENSHVIPGLIRRFHEAKEKNSPEVVIWGTGTPMREFLYVDDMAAASVFVMELDKLTYDQHIEPMQSHINVGFGSDITIKELAEMIGKTVKYEGSIAFDTNKADGAPRKLMNTNRLHEMGWQAKINLVCGLARAYEDFLQMTNQSMVGRG
jgi:GDP-L-fucose synthase